MLREIIRAICEDYDRLEPNETIANRVAEAYSTLAAYREATWPILVDEVRRVRREEDRALIEEAYTAMRGMREGRVCDPASERAEWLARKVTVPGKFSVDFAHATIDQHQERIDYLSKQRDALGMAIGEHAEAIRRIKAAGVSCLAEIVETVAAA